MRKLFPVVLLAALVLPSCVLAIGNKPDPHDSDARVQKLEKRIVELEKQLKQQQQQPQ